MLLHFHTENFRSIRDGANVSLIATSLLEHRDSLVNSKYAKYGVLPVIAFYGGNASGKSNFLQAIAFMRSVVLHSFKHSEVDSDIPIKPFLLDEESANKPSTFVLDFVLQGIRYQLGFSLTRKRVTEEWLYTYPKRSQQVLYHRSIEADHEYYFGRTLTGSIRQIQSITPANALFISTAAASAHPLLTEVWHYFKDHLVLRLAPGATPNARLALELDEDESLLAEAAKYLAMADTGISDVRIETLPVEKSTSARLNELYQLTSKTNVDTFSPDVSELNKKIQLGHVGVKKSGNQLRYLDLEQESLGTQYLLSLLPALLTTLKHGRVLVLDEITTSLHTHIARCLVSLFVSKVHNPKGAQLIFSTHDTNLLAPGLLRRDEAWLADKSNQGVTSITPLSTYKTKITDNIERGYLQGRFGAVPYLRGKLKTETK